MVNSWDITVNIGQSFQSINRASTFDRTLIYNVFEQHLMNTIWAETLISKNRATTSTSQLRNVPVLTHAEHVGALYIHSASHYAYIHASHYVQDILPPSLYPFSYLYVNRITTEKLSVSSGHFLLLKPFVQLWCVTPYVSLSWCLKIPYSAYVFLVNHVTRTRF